MNYSEYVKFIKLRLLLVIIISCYFLLWLLDANKAGGIFWNILGLGNDTTEWVVSLKPELSRRLLRTGNQETTLSSKPNRVEVNAEVLTDFLAKSNNELRQLRKGFYNKPAGYYIQINSNQGTCQARYSTEFHGYWETPAKILCPQIKQLLTAHCQDLMTIACQSLSEKAAPGSWKDD